jgi:serine protease Do
LIEAETPAAGRDIRSKQPSYYVVLVMRFALIGCLLVSLCHLGYSGAPPAPKAADSNPQCGYLGIGIDPVDEHIAASLGMREARGALVLDVQDGFAAARAGLRPGDVILEFEGQQVNDPGNLGSLVSQTRPGKKVHLTVLRGSRELHLTAVLSAKSSAASAEPMAHIDLPSPGFLIPDLPSPALRWQSRRIGIEYEGVDSQLAEFFGVKQGILIRFVLPGSPAQRAGLKAGDVLIKFDGKPIAGPRDLAVAFDEQGAPRTKASLEVVRDRKPRSILLPLSPNDSMSPPPLHKANNK